MINIEQKITIFIFVKFQIDNFSIGQLNRDIASI